jgi:uncharacterized protein (TIGR02246 family)
MTMRDDEQAIRALIAKWTRAVEAKDADAIVADYAEEAVLFDAIPPAKTVGRRAIRDVWAKCFPYFPETFRSEHKDLAVVVGGDVAFAHGFHHFLPRSADHPAGSTWMRVTIGFAKRNGRWRVAHEHVSAPFDPVSGKAELIKNA